MDQRVTRYDATVLEGLLEWREIQDKRAWCAPAQKSRLDTNAGRNGGSWSATSLTLAAYVRRPMRRTSDGRIELARLVASLAQAL